MDPNDLRGSLLPKPKYCLAPLSPQLETIAGYKALQTYFPTLTAVFDIPKKRSHEFCFDTKWRIVGLDLSQKGPGNGKCNVSVVANDLSDVSSASIPAYIKVTHLLDPVRWMQNKYSLPKESGLPAPTKSWEEAWNKLQDPSNQAYVEVMASYALGKLREKGLSPHFNHFYGSFCSIADTYLYDITDDIDSFREMSWFWKGKRRGIYSVRIENADDPNHILTAEECEEILQENEFSAGSETSSQTSFANSDEILDDFNVGNVEIMSLHSDNLEDMSLASDESDSETESDSESDTDYVIQTSLKNFPVMLLCMEKNTGTMDSLLYEDQNSELNENKWVAWIFQIVAALVQIQSLFGFTHNDLHTNNIVYIETDQEFLYYSSRAGQIWKVPTYGKIFRIIDFGRSIFKLNGHQFISDDFSNGNVAEGQYDFEPLTKNPRVVIPPNPSFDLCRLAVSLFEGLFPKSPKDKDGGRILSEEDGIKIYETESDLCNMLWEWMIDDDNKNVFIDKDGSERFPSFDLYRHIAQYIHNAVPRVQLGRAIFSGFKTDAAAPDGVSTYNLFI